MNTAIRAEAAQHIQLFAHQHPPALLDLARHAALPVALDPGLVHLLRTNFFLDRPDAAPLPATAEADLLLSNLCYEVGDGLYEMEPAVRDVLLKGLGEDRLREVATLLWQYTTRRAPWIDRPMLERAQQLTALSVLDLERAQRWLDETEGNPGTMGTEEKEWFVAMRSEIAVWKKAESGPEHWSSPHSQTYDVFLSYNARDHQAVERVGRWLRDRDIDCFMDRWYLVPGTPWPVALEQALARSKAVVIFLGPGGMGRWQQRELYPALDRQANSGVPVIPVLLPGSDPALGFLSLNTWVDLRARLDDERQLDTLAAAIRGLAAAESEGRGESQAVCPFRGLLPYREEDAPFFFGRQEDTNRLVEAVARHSFVAVLGASGSGKSSVLRAGLVPRLRFDPNTVWDIVVMVPTDRPLNVLVNALSPLLWPDVEDGVDRREKANEKTSSLERGTLSLRDLAEIALGKQPGTQRLLLVVDQWEELYTLCREDRVIRSFTDQLLDASQTSPLTVVLTCRADFYGRVLDYRPLVDRIKEGAQVSLGPMDEAELREVVEAPAAKVGLEYEPGLPERILGDIGRDPGRLPLLSFLPVLSGTS